MNKISTPLGILIILIIAILIGGGVLAYQYWWLPKQETPPQESPSIKVLSPNGGETWEIGKTYSVKWKTAGDVTGKYVVIYYNQINSALEGAIDEPIIATEGSYDWTINEHTENISIQPGHYKISLILYDSLPRFDLWSHDTSYQLPKIIGQDSSDSPFSIAAAPGCSMKWWFDNKHTTCGYSQFCGVYMYYGLQTFDTQADCQANLP